MARPCATCSHPQKASIDLKLLRGHTASSIAKEHNLQIDAVLRHKANHLSKSSEADTTLAMLKQVIAELDDAAALALAQDDIRACVDARKRKADLVQVLLQQELSDAKATTKGNDLQTIDLSLLDSIMEKVRKNYDKCPLCHGYTVPKATGNATGKAVN